MSDNLKATVEGAFLRAISNKTRTIFSLSPLHFEAREEAEMEKKVVCVFAATAFASMVFPVPGGP